MSTMRPRPNRGRFVALALGAALATTGACSCDRRPAGSDAGSATASGTTPTPPTRRDRPVAVGTVRGRILLAEGAELPRWTREDIDRGSDRPPLPPECPPARDSDTLPVTGVGTPTSLVGVMVSATGEREPFFRNLGEWAPREHALGIDACRLTPKLVSATVGDTLVVTNHSDVPYLPTAGPSEHFEVVMMGQSRRIPLGRPGVSWVKCGFSMSCARSDLVVIAHPVHAVTGADGRYEMRNVPADMPVQIHAWHPMFRATSAVTRVERNGEVELDLILSPILPSAPAAGAVRVTGVEGPMADFPSGQVETVETPTPDRPRPPRPQTSPSPAPER